MKTSNVSEFYWFLKNARLENAKVGGRGSESASKGEISLPRDLNRKARLEIASGPKGTQ